MSTPSTHLTVLGSGAWGTALACLLAEGSNVGRVTLWSRRPEFAEQLRHERHNRDYLPGRAFPDRLEPTSDLPSAVEGVDAVFIAVPSKGIHAVMEALPPVSALVCCSKGIEIKSSKRLTEVLASYQAGAALAALSGPNLAGEIAMGRPASTTVASPHAVLAEQVQQWLNGPTFRVYTSRDVAGVEIGGALKNVIALAAGMCDGLQLGDNAKATIITRGLAELIRYGRYRGGEIKTFYGLSGLGDMIATCGSAKSRNHTAGVRFAQGWTLERLEASGMTTEGIPTVQAVVQDAKRAGLELPIAEAVHSVVYEGMTPVEGVRDLMSRDPKSEWE